jgi:hypothetical protein
MFFRVSAEAGGIPVGGKSLFSIRASWLHGIPVPVYTASIVSGDHCLIPARPSTPSHELPACLRSLLARRCGASRAAHCTLRSMPA